MKRGIELRFLLLISLSLFLLINFASAEVYVGQIDSFYHFSDDLNMTITISPVVKSNDFLDVKLLCLTENNSTSTSIDLYISPYSLEAGQERVIFIPFRLDRSLIGEVSGRCSISASYANEEGNSKSFEISKKLDVKAEGDRVSLNPGEIIKISGSALRLNGKSVDGFVEANIKEINLSIFGTVNQGKFELNFSSPMNMKSGLYEVSIRAYEKDELGDVINEGYSKIGFGINQIVKKLEINFNENSATPGKDFVYKVFIYDQSEEMIKDSITVNLFDPNEKKIIEKLIESGEERSFSFNLNSTPGYWTIRTQYRNIEADKIFQMQELQLASFELKNNTLFVKNMGNVPYTRSVEVLIGEESRVVPLDIPVGGSDRYKLSAPEGEYNIEVKTGESEQDLGSALLTGNAIRVSDFGIGSAIQDNYSIIIWILVLIVLGFVLYHFFRKTPKDFGKSPKLVKFDGKSTQNLVNSTVMAGSSHSINEGRRQKSEVISLKIKNLDQVESNERAKSLIDETLMQAKSQRAKIYSSGNYKIIIFAPLITGQEDNALLAVSIANNIKEKLNSYNSKSENKIKYGIGVNSGEMIVEKKEGTFKFTSIGSIVSLAKNISESSDSEVFISKNVYGKVVGKVKTEKHPGRDFWIVKRVASRSQHEQFIDKFKERQKVKK